MKTIKDTDKNKSIWIPPRLYILDISKTGGGGDPAQPEDNEYSPDDTGSA